MGGRSITGTGDEGITLMGNGVSAALAGRTRLTGPVVQAGPVVPMHNLGKVPLHDEEKRARKGPNGSGTDLDGNVVITGAADSLAKSVRCGVFLI